MLIEIEQNIQHISELCKKYHVSSLSLFGSAVKNNIHSESDVDLLVLFSNEIEVIDYADNYFSLLEELQKLIKKPIDLVSVKSLKNPILIQEINQHKVELYAA